MTMAVPPAPQAERRPKLVVVANRNSGATFDPASRWDLSAGNEVQQRRLTRAVHANDAQPASRLDEVGEVVDDLRAVWPREAHIK